MALLEELRGDFDEHDAFLHLLLGLVSLSERFERLLPSSRSIPGEGSAAPAGEDERLVLLLLGLISVHRSLVGALEPLRATGRSPASTISSGLEAELSRLRELLR
ncbi:hypothetical protein [Vitiosangium sp. GDMCC 1.1324]|uniref:hypothetical protein n=1 Tax=Vitiosangium sp. (strain GDMCC 1.1324) TaxID=2138576 RepID=UPI000D341638|nr:hypothetical protein [Vitiosangium sp. GDMCC 1.1324]PTL79663.1 hypothetical protein DAT35_33200 [Vitiosangium sp. GDMCC 1.1324]